MTLSYCARQVRRLDHDRFLTALFAPVDRRENLFALYAFNTEVARVREVVTEAMLGRIRLQWWRDAIGEIYSGGTVREHGVATALADAIRAGGLPREPFDRLIDSRERDLDDEPPATLADLEAYAEATSGTLSMLAAHLLGGPEPEVREAARSVGTAWALTGLLRALPFLARQRRSVIPDDLAAETGVRHNDLYGLRSTPEIAAACAKIADVARGYLARARRSQPRPAKEALAAVLPAVLAELYLRRMARHGHDLLGHPVDIGGPRKQAALMSAALRRRY